MRLGSEELRALGVCRSVRGVRRRLHGRLARLVHGAQSPLGSLESYTATRQSWCRITARHSCQVHDYSMTSVSWCRTAPRHPCHTVIFHPLGLLLQEVGRVGRSVTVGISKTFWHNAPQRFCPTVGVYKPCQHVPPGGSLTQRGGVITNWGIHYHQAEAEGWGLTSSKSCFTM